MNLTFVIGAATRPGRLARAVRYLEEQAVKLDSVDQIEIIDPSQVHIDFCDGRPESDYGKGTQNAVASVSRADAVVFASPVYRATYPGVLKNFIDLLPIESLRDKPVGIIAMGATNHHFLGVDSQMRFVLSWFGALVMPNSVYITGEDFSEGQLVSKSSRKDLEDLAKSIAELTLKTSNSQFGPVPLAAK